MVPVAADGRLYSNVERSRYAEWRSPTTAAVRSRCHLLHHHRSEVLVGEGLRSRVGDIDAAQRVCIRDAEGNRGRLVPLPQAAI
jgi:hypothetical protein